MTGAESLRTNFSGESPPPISANKNHLKVVPTNENKSKQQRDFDDPLEILRMSQEQIRKYISAKNKQREELLKKEISKAFRIIDEARKHQGIHTLPGFSFSQDDFPDAIKTKFKQSKFYENIQGITDKKKLQEAIEKKIQFSELEKRLFNLARQKNVFRPYHITEQVKEYREQVLAVGRGYESSLKCTHQNALKAIDFMLQNPYLNLRSQEEAIEFIYLAIARGMDLPSPLWKHKKAINEEDAIYFSKVYLDNLKGRSTLEAKEKTKSVLEKQYGVIIPLTVIENYLNRIIKAPYRKEKTNFKKTKLD